ncbi:MAG: PAS domain-containing protein [Pseudobdellovibrionaceae bacterium]|nr:PAS domain-containing protein [Bdellovibrionales bacterium]USN47145.1 MAG: PAS domain-containing protein [Pseudobdellovibrionaceae bacterium]
MDYSIFDSLIDGVFVLRADRSVLYCNEAAATLAESSVRRLTRGGPIYDHFKFDDETLFVMPKGEWGKDEATPYKEVAFELKSGKLGRVQLAIQPFTDAAGELRWVLMLHDVTLEEVLHKKYHKQLEEKEVVIDELKIAQEKLEAYSKNLESMVEERTRELKSANLMLSAIMDSLGQGFLVFNEGGVCSKIFTKACEDVLECNPADKNIWDVLRLDSSESETFQMWMKAVYSEALPFADLKNLAPNEYKHSENRFIELDYYPLNTDEGSIGNVVLVATDKTAVREANLALEKEKQFVKMVMKIVANKGQFSKFLASCVATISSVKTLVSQSSDLDINYLFRLLHTLEGEAATYSANELWRASRMVQEVLEPLRSGKAENPEAVIVNLKRSVNDLETSYSDFMANNEKLFTLTGVAGSRRVEVTLEEVSGLMDDLRKRGVPEEACVLVQNLLLAEPVAPLFMHMNDVATLVAERTGKKLKPMYVEGGEIRVYPAAYEELFSTLVHAFRNAVDHGIEPPEERQMAGKDEQGQIKVVVKSTDSGQQQWLEFHICDDGGGIDASRVRRKMQEMGRGNEIEGLSDHQVIQYIFDDGFSTRDSVSDFSGRGVGMSAIKASAEELGGTVEVQTQPGVGSRLMIKVPLIVPNELVVAEAIAS